MNKCIFIPLIISILSCSQNDTIKSKNDKENQELKVDSEILKSIHDSLNSTGEFKYYEKYIVKIDEMINKYPEQKQLLKVKESMKEIYIK